MAGVVAAVVVAHLRTYLFHQLPLCVLDIRGGHAADFLQEQLRVHEVELTFVDANRLPRGMHSPTTHVDTQARMHTHN